MESKLLTARIDEGLIDRFREKAKADGKSMSEILKMLISQYIDPQKREEEEDTRKRDETTKVVRRYLDSHRYDNYEEKVDDFKSVVTQMLSDVDEMAKEEIIRIALTEVNWDFLHQREHDRMILAKKEAEKNRREQENLGDIPF